MAICSDPDCKETHENGLYIDERQFEELDLWICCPKCGERTKPAKDKYGTYCYKCDSCKFQVRLADLLPDKSLFIHETGLIGCTHAR